ncbi:glycosyltransferase [Anaerococcus sp. AGMB09787]|uniref:glycosyltransferase n=1 Tax=Anaerococcus sp. AGMB09787 TaxID=2922869 RepID=UPI001FAEAF81|nr:glycosyltransferase [Anaerococcus sp. AGMB09787]
MKILITSDFYYPVVNGVVRSVLNLKKYLEGKGHEVRVLTLSNTLKSYKSKGVYYIGSLSARRIYPQARVTNILSKTYFKEIERWKPDIIHSQCEFSTFIMAKIIAYELEIPLVHTYHTVYEDYTHYLLPMKTTGKKVVALASKRFANLCDKIIAPSEKTSDILKGYGIDPKKIVVIPTGIDMPEIYKQDSRDILGINQDQKVILYLGRIAEEKNIEEIIDFYQRIADSSIKLYIVGGGPHLKILQDYDKNHAKKPNFLGMVDPSLVNKYYQAADVFVSASTSETQGLTYYEALANGLPVLCKKDKALDGVVFDGYNGFQYEDYEDFEKKLLKVLDNDNYRDYLKRNARSYALENFSIKSFGEKCEKLYREAITGYNYESFDI